MECTDENAIQVEIEGCLKASAEYPTGDWRGAISLLDQSGLHPDEIRLERYGDSMFEVAVLRCELDACRQLMTRGARMDPRPRKGRPVIVELIRCRDEKWGRRHDAMVELLQATINAQDSAGMTALMFAATGAGLFGSKRGNVGLIKRLLTLGADPLIRDNIGGTALTHAVRSNNKSAAEANAEVVHLLEGAMVTAAAMNAFHEHFEHRFGGNGEFEVQPKARAETPHPREVRIPRTRFNAARGDATVGTIAAKIEQFFGIPEGSVALVDAQGRRLRRNAHISTLRKRHDE